jgi:hypothetical protein
MKQSNSAGVIFLSNLGLAENRNKVYLCKCPQCGNEFTTFASDFYMGRNHCECKWIGKHNKRLYSIWINMKTRCYNPNVKGYKDYGGRGISICEEWRNSFKTFYEWAVGNGYADDLTIDRKDVNGNYTPENCRWIGLIEQANNKRTNILINGMSLKKYCRENGLNYKTVHTRKTRHPEMSIEDIIGWYLERRKQEVTNE